MDWKKLYAALLNPEDPIYQAQINDQLGNALVVNTSQGAATRYYLGKPYVHVYLTQRELQVFSHLLFGRTMRRIGEMMQLSPRTIEFYLLNMKRKLHCHTKQVLMSKVMGSELMSGYCDWVMSEEEVS